MARVHPRTSERLAKLSLAASCERVGGLHAAFIPPETLDRLPRLHDAAAPRIARIAASC